MSDVFFPKEVSSGKSKLFLSLKTIPELKFKSELLLNLFIFSKSNPKVTD